MAAERDTIDRLVAHWLADRVGATFPGASPGVTRAGLFVKLDETGADGFVPMRTLGCRLLQLRRGPPRGDRPLAPARCIGWAMPSRSSWSRRYRLPARCASNSCRRAGSFPGRNGRGSIGRSGAEAARAAARAAHKMPTQRRGTINPGAASVRQRVGPPRLVCSPCSAPTGWLLALFPGGLRPT